MTKKKTAKKKNAKKTKPTVEYLPPETDRMVAALQKFGEISLHLKEPKK
jgi:hypothetical protein